LYDIDGNSSPIYRDGGLLAKCDKNKIAIIIKNCYYNNVRYEQKIRKAVAAIIQENSINCLETS